MQVVSYYIISNLFTRKGTINSFGGFIAPNTTFIGSPYLGPKFIKNKTNKSPAIKFCIIVETFFFYLKQHRIIKMNFNTWTIF